jgi:hypothetical protein
MKMPLLFICSLFTIVSANVIASNTLTIKCNVRVEGERSDVTTSPSITFDAEKGYKNLSFDVYGSKVSVTSTFFMSNDGKTCGNKVDQICVNLKSSVFCSDKPIATLYPTDRYAQPGDRASVECSLIGLKTFPCPLN